MAIAATLALFALGAQPANAEPDVSAPVVVSHAVTKTTLDVTAADASLIFSVRISDETAVSEFVARIRHPESGQNYYFSSEELVSGTLQNGVWRAGVILPQGSAAGSWVVDVLALKDTLANTTNAFINVRMIVVKSATPDVSAPVVVSHAVTKTTLDVTVAEAPLILSVRITDETAVSGFAARIRDPESRQSHFFASEELVSGTLQNGVWRAAVTLPQGSAAGSWLIQIFAVSDTRSNTTSGYENLRAITVKSAA